MLHAKLLFKHLQCTKLRFLYKKIQTMQNKKFQAL